MTRTGTQRRQVATQEGGRKGAGEEHPEQRGESRGQRAGKRERTNGGRSPRSGDTRWGDEKQRGEATADRSRGTAILRRERRDRSRTESHKNEDTTRPNRVMQRKQVEVVHEASSSSSGWP